MSDTKRSRLEMIVAVCAVVTSVIALFVAWDQGRVMRAQQHGAVYPVLQVDGFVSTTMDHRQLGIQFTNSGVGPALIESVEAVRNGEPIASLNDHYARMPAGNELSWTSMVGRAVAPGDNIGALVISWPMESISHAALLDASQQWSDVQLNICYCSVFGRCWTTVGLGKARTEPVKKCTRSDGDIFEELSSAAPLTEQEIIEVE
ncbi:hypothetical protein K1X12_01695 [Hyphomonas sp. WL0036]|uniref:hypothetical protein n=1 Tax=Hyphomonas sediminis TaxID=2866160 RepID=UPI001C81A91E|nr:hypothetical protein [Hyphomonas sediminis]MBY9065591.1 hypothetical protein [Hyphomonas sediminis]